MGLLVSSLYHKMLVLVAKKIKYAQIFVNVVFSGIWTDDDDDVSQLPILSGRLKRATSAK